MSVRKIYAIALAAPGGVWFTFWVMYRLSKLGVNEIDTLGVIGAVMVISAIIILLWKQK